MIQIREMQVRDTDAVAEIERQIFFTAVEQTGIFRCSQPW